eukprot:COSAG02_NODE_30107_length_557_cov_0.781659_1_plen_27_part_01
MQCVDRKPTMTDVRPQQIHYGAAYQGA